MSQTTSPPAVQTDVDFVALKAGQTIGRYEILAILGQGGFGITYRARDTQLGREVAIKEYLPTALAVRQDGVTVLPRSTRMAEDFTWGRERFVSEGQTLASLHGAPAIVHVFDFLEANGTAYIVMELLSGETLEDRLKRDGKLDSEAVDKILWPLLDGLEVVHKAGFLHRDIKPANILLSREGKPTLIDFGASRAAMVGRTTALTAIFTPGYAAAEQMTSAKQGPWTDIYGVSATLYHAITGHVPPSAFDRMLEDKYQPLAQLAPPGFTRGLCAGIDAGLTVVSISRPQSIAGWRSILGMTAAPTADATVVIGRGDAAVSAPSVTPGAPPPVVGAAGKRSVGPWLAVAILLVALLGGGGYYFAAMRGPDPEMVKVQAAAKVADDARQKAEQEAAALREQRAKAEQAAAEVEHQKRLEEESRRKAALEAAEQQKAEAERKRAEEEARRRADDEAEARRKAIEFVAGNFDHFGRNLLLVGLTGRPDEVHLQGVDIVDDPGLRQLAVNALASQSRHVRCRQTDRLTDGTPLYRCLITPLNAKPPLDQISDSERIDLALALVRNGLVLASCDAPRAYADAEDEARGRSQSLWGRVKIDDYKRRCAK